MRLVAFVICLIMMTVPLSGCLGGNDIETSEGNDIILEDIDDWPTYYVLTAGDLPACPGPNNDNLGRLYYVESDTNFQACMSTGWQVVQIGGSGSTLILNSAPILSSTVWMADDDMFADDGDGTYSRLLYIDWAAMDIDGTIASLGIDYDSDGTIDIPFSQNSGLFSDQTPVQATNGDDYGGAFQIPFEVGNTIFQMEDYANIDQCSLIIQKSLIVMAVDDDGAVTYNPLVFDALGGFGMEYQPMTSWMLSGTGATAFNIPQADMDWLTGVSSSCLKIPQLSFVDHPDALTTGQTDNMAILTVDDPGDWATWVSMMDSDENFYIEGYCVSPGGVGLWLEDEDYTFSGVDEETPQAGEYWTVSEGGDFGVCDSSADTFRVALNFGNNRVTIETTMS